MRERNTFICGTRVSETELREALKRIEEQPTHGWKVGDIFRYRSSGNIWRVNELNGLDKLKVKCLWSNSGFEPSKNVYTFDSPDQEMVKLVEENSNV
jgi:hypothetical protein